MLCLGWRPACVGMGWVGWWDDGMMMSQAASGVGCGRCTVGALNQLIDSASAAHPRFAGTKGKRHTQKLAPRAFSAGGLGCLLPAAAVD